MENQDRGKTVYIGNLNYNRDENGVKWLFSQYGKIRDVKLMRDAATENSLGYGFVKMIRSTDADKAIRKLNQKVIDGRTLKVSEAKESQTYKEMKEPVQEQESEGSKKATRKRNAEKKKKQGLQVLFNYLQK